MPARRSSSVLTLRSTFLFLSSLSTLASESLSTIALRDVVPVLGIPPGGDGLVDGDGVQQHGVVQERRVLVTRFVLTHLECTRMPILAAETLLRENKKKIQSKLLPPVGLRVKHYPFYTNLSCAT